MKAIEFKNQNKILTDPGDDLPELPVWINSEMVISRWQLSWIERLQLLIFGKLWMAVITDQQTQPPILLRTETNIFGKTVEQLPELKCRKPKFLVHVTARGEMFYKCHFCGSKVTEEQITNGTFSDHFAEAILKDRDLVYFPDDFEALK